ncbi:hypothetical protein [Nocardia lijiangensis]|uniref:hypothetical protein n=1 Tax=Nocardia lijiangensis TaxID=299618 RepID=UPI0008295E5D|nr:hypothetical protein [Nocardia lijiangensis]
MAEARGKVDDIPLRMPHSAAVAGIVFAVLFATAIVLVRTALPDTPPAASPRVVDDGRIRAAFIIVPFASIAFLWFIGVVRSLLGKLEDRFFSTVSLGSGLLFLALTSVSTAVAGGILATSQRSNLDENGIIYFGRQVVLDINHIYAVRMAAVFMISLATIWLRTRLMPRWLPLITYPLALILLLVLDLSLWAALVFPAWVLVVSVTILVANRPESPPALDDIP